MLIGCTQLINDFKALSRNGRLSHAYLFFGEPQVGKFLFARNLANFLENKVFDFPSSFLSEELVISSSDEGSIGIDAVRSLKQFLYQKPIFSERRIVIIRDAENLTIDAQNAVLKILEEPSAQSLIILIIDNYENLSLPVLSRLQKIYFSRVSSVEIEKFLISEYKIESKKAKKIAAESFGRPGRAINLLKNKDLENIKKMAKEFYRINNLKIKRAFIKEKFINKEGKFNDDLMDRFLEFLIIELRHNLFKNHKELQEIFKRLVLIKQFNVNKKLQIQCL